MLKDILLSVAIIASSHTLAQSIEEKIASDVCSCMNQKEATTAESGFLNFEKCLRTDLEKYKAELTPLAEAQRDPKLSDYQNGKKFGVALSFRVQVKLIANCDQFYHLLDSSRSSPFKTRNHEAGRKQLAKADSMMRAKRSIEHLYLRALAYAQLQQYDKALDDANTMLEMDSTFMGAYGIKGMMLELNGDYHGAKAVYQKALAITKFPMMELMAALVDRKLKERK